MNFASPNSLSLKLLRNSTLAFSLLVAPSTWAGGLFLSERATTDSVGTTGVSGITNNTTAEAGVSNPAGLTGLKASQLQLGVQVVDLRLEFDSTSPPASAGTANGSSTSLVPSTFYAYPVNDKMVLGASVHGAGGLGYDFSSDWAGRNFINDTEFSFLNITGSIGYKVNEKLSLGGALVIQQFYLEATTTTPALLLPPPLGTERKLETDGDDINPGFTLGLMYQVADATRVGFHYVSKIEHDLEMDLNINGSRVPVVDEILSGSFVIQGAQPSSFTFGVSHQLDQQWRLMGRLAYEKWSEFGELTIKPAGGGSIDANLNLDDIYDIGIAAEHSAPGRTTYFGLSYAESMVSDENRVISLPVSESIKLGIGAEWALGSDRFFGLAYELAMLGDAKVNQTNAGGTLNGSTGDYYIHFISATYRY